MTLARRSTTASLAANPFESRNLTNQELVPIPSYFTVLEVIKGTNSDIYKALNKQTNQIVAIKVLSPQHYAGPEGSKKLDMIQREFRIGQHLNHKNISPYLAAFSDGLNYFVVRQWEDGFSLSEMIKNNQLTDQLLKKILIELISAVSYCHDREIIHRDIKPSNIIVSLDETGELKSLKLIDFGAVKDAKSESTTVTSHIGSFGFTAPEAYTFPAKLSDIYSIGATIFYAKTGKLSEIRYDDKKEWKELLDRCGAFKPIIVKCLELDVENRYQNVSEIDAAISLGSSLVLRKKDSIFQRLRFRFRSSYKKLIYTYADFSYFGSDQLHQMLETGEYKYIPPNKLSSFIKSIVSCCDGFELLKMILENKLEKSFSNELEARIYDIATNFTRLKELIEELNFAVPQKFIPHMYIHSNSDEAFYLFKKGLIDENKFNLRIDTFWKLNNIKELLSCNLSSDYETSLVKAIQDDSVRKECLFLVKSESAQLHLAHEISKSQNPSHYYMGVLNSNKLPFSVYEVFSKKITDQENAFRLLTDDNLKNIETEIHLSSQIINPVLCRVCFSKVHSDEAKAILVTRFTLADLSQVIIHQDYPKTHMSVLLRYKELGKSLSIPWFEKHVLEYNLTNELLSAGICATEWGSEVSPDADAKLLAQKLIISDRLSIEEYRNLTNGTGTWKHFKFPQLNSSSRAIHPQNIKAAIFSQLDLPTNSNQLSKKCSEFLIFGADQVIETMIAEKVTQKDDVINVLQNAKLSNKSAEAILLSKVPEINLTKLKMSIN